MLYISNLAENTQNIQKYEQNYKVLKSINVDIAEYYKNNVAKKCQKGGESNESLEK